MGRRGHIGRGALNCVETLLMHSKCLRKFPQKELSLVSCIEKFAKYSFACLREYPRWQCNFRLYVLLANYFNAS